MSTQSTQSPEMVGYIILTLRGTGWQPFARTTMPMLHQAKASALEELAQIQLNYPGHKFTIGSLNLLEGN